MAVTEEYRTWVIGRLLHFAEPFDSLNQRIAQIPWDYTGVGVEMNIGHIKSVLERYLKGDLTKEDVENWANAIEGREDINFRMSSAPAIEETIFELANPVLTQSLTARRAAELLTELSTAE